jgi:ABC-type uncharacterized transport system auxiliary subunit
MKLRLVFLLSFCLMAVACTPSFKSSHSPAFVYALHPGEACGRGIHGRQDKKMLAVAVPHMPPGFETNRIPLYMAGGRRLEYFSGAEWPEEFDLLLQDFIIRSASHACAPFLAVPADSGAAAYSLEVRVNEFQPVYAASPDLPPELALSMTFTLLSSADRKTVTAFTLLDRKIAAENRISIIIEGMEGMLRRTLSRAFQRISPMVR